MPNATPPWERAIGSARQRLGFASVAVALVLFRSFIPTYYEGFHFDSDQAIVGLMARHLSTLHDFPLYYYGLNYLLGVEAWIIAPCFWLFRSSVTVMRVPLVILNAGAAVWLMAEIGKRARLSPALAFTAALPLIVPTPAASGQLLEAAGACIEPFLYILLLWRLRFRPLAFGMVLALGTLHREFTLFALPAIVIVEATRGELWVWTNIRRAARMACGFGLVWLIVDDLKMHLSGAALTLQISSLGNQMCWDRDWPQRVAALARQALPTLFGSVRVALSSMRLTSPVETGHTVVAWLIGLGALVMVARLMQGRRQTQQANPEAGFGPYLAWVGAFTACAYPLSCNVVFGLPPLLRYLLLALLLPVGLFATFAGRETSRPLRGLVASIFVVWAAFNLFDNARVVVSAVRNPPVSEHRILADYLVSHHIRYARAVYWDAYVVDFLARERVTVESSDLVRIPEYQRLVDDHAKIAVTVVRQPCTGDDTIASWCIQNSR